MRTRRRRDERGAVAAEAALVMLPLFLVMMGIVEASMLMRDVAAANSSVAAGARTSSVSAAAGSCDTSCSSTSAPRLAEVTADAIERAGGAIPRDRINWVMVYDADSTTGMPENQASGFAQSQCNTRCVVYKPNPAGELVYVSGSWNTTTTVNACINDANRDAVGVAVEVQHEWLTGFFGNNFTYTQRNVMQFEPLPTETCLPGEHA
jgi:hypothetical protein